MPDLISLATVLPIADHGHWGTGPWFLLVPLIWVAIVVTVIWLIRGPGGRRGWGPRGGPSAKGRAGSASTGSPSRSPVAAFAAS
jgi:hypothetical protein